MAVGQLHGGGFPTATTVQHQRVVLSESWQTGTVWDCNRLASPEIGLLVAY